MAERPAVAGWLKSPAATGWACVAATSRRWWCIRGEEKIQIPVAEEKDASLPQEQILFAFQFLTPPAASGFQFSCLAEMLVFLGSPQFWHDDPIWIPRSNICMQVLLDSFLTAWNICFQACRSTSITATRTAPPVSSNYVRLWGFEAGNHLYLRAQNKKWQSFLLSVHPQLSCRPISGHVWFVGKYVLAVAELIYSIVWQVPPKLGQTLLS